MNEVTCPRCDGGRPMGACADSYVLSFAPIGQIRIVIMSGTVYYTCLDCGKSWQEELRRKQETPVQEPQAAVSEEEMNDE